MIKYTLNWWKVLTIVFIVPFCVGGLVKDNKECMMKKYLLHLEKKDVKKILCRKD